MNIFKSIQFDESDTTLNPILTIQEFNLIPTGSCKYLTKNYCASCHIKNDNYIGPNLKGILSKRSMNWIQRYLTARESLKLKVEPTKKDKFRCVEIKSLSYEVIDWIINFLNWNSKI